MSINHNVIFSAAAPWHFLWLLSLVQIVCLSAGSQYSLAAPTFNVIREVLGSVHWEALSAFEETCVNSVDTHAFMDAIEAAECPDEV